MATPARLQELLSRWDRDRSPAEELCRHCPELLEQVRAKIQALEKMEALLGLESDTPGSYLPDQSSRSDYAETPPSRLGPAEAAEQDQDDQSPHPAAGPPTADFGPPNVEAVLNSHVEVVPGASVGRYRLVQRLGKGGFGEVWEAFDPELHRAVAIKLPRPDKAFTEEERAQILHEARKVAALKHPHIVPVYDVIRAGDTCFVVSEFMEGSTLARLLSRGRLPFAESARVAADIADALHHAHLQNVVHRDVKPGNVLLDRQGKAHLADFGLAVSEEEQYFEQRAVVGTVSYMSPEQARGDSNRVDARTDIYSLGVMFYEMLSGRLPYKASTRSQYREQILTRNPRPPRTVDDHIPAELERICLKCLAKSPSKRYTTAADLAIELRTWLEQSSATTPAPVKPQRRLSIRAAALLAVPNILAGAIWLVLANLPQGNPPPDPPGEEKPEANAVKVRKLLVREWLGRDWGILGGNSVHLDGEDHAVLALGQNSSPNLELSANISHHGNWGGGVGFVFGHNQTKIGAETHHKYQAVRLYKIEHKWFLEHICEEARINPSSPLQSFPKVISIKQIEQPTPTDFHLAIRICDNKPVKVYVKGAEVSLNASSYYQMISSLDAKGDYGIYHWGGISTFSHIRVDGQLLKQMVKD